MGGAVSSIASGFTRARDTINNATGTRAGDLIGMAGGSPVMGLATNALAGLAGDGEQAPEAPGVDPQVAALHRQQIKNANEFRANIPKMQGQMGENLRVQGNNQLSNELQGIKTNNSSRGLLYGGINAAQKAGARANTQANVAKGTSDINTGLLNEANTLDTQALQSGVGIQQSQQAIQNALYSQAMARMSANNAMTGSIAGAGISGLLMRG